MPTVLREAGFEFRIYTDDHPPAHVHVIRAGEEAVIDLGTDATRPLLRENFGMNKKNLRRAFLIVNQRQTLFLRAWRLLHG